MMFSHFFLSQVRKVLEVKEVARAQLERQLERQLAASVAASTRKADDA